MRASVVAEKAGIASVAVVCEAFKHSAHLVAEGEGVPDVRLAEYPGAIDTQSNAEREERVDNYVLPKIIEGLTKTLEARKAKTEESAAGRIVLSGTFEEVNEFFCRRGWTDGLPIVPPTSEKVEQFLRYTDLSPDEEVAVLPMANLSATPRNIAVNGVMAGCRPEYMPVLIAAVEAIGDPKYCLKNIGHTGGQRPYLLINGPVAKQLNLYSGAGLITPGACTPGVSIPTNPNTTIGRALFLIVRNIAGFKPGVSEMGAFGLPLPFVLVEDEDEDPWEPYHVEHGFDRDTSTVTAMAWNRLSGAFASNGDKAHPHLRTIGLNLVHRCGPYHSFVFGPLCMTTILISPPVAKVLAADGYSKRDAAAQIRDNARITVRTANELLGLEYSEGTTLKPGMGQTTIHNLVQAGTLPPSFDLGPDERIPVLLSTEQIHIVVCGSHGRNRNLLLYSAYQVPVIKKIRLPDNWDKLQRAS